MIAVTRDEARFMFLQAGDRLELLDFDRLRNYEIERELDELAGVDTTKDDSEGLYVIAEWCPFNGIYCAWREHAPPGFIEQTIREVEEVRHVWEADRATGSSRYPNPDYHLDTLRRALDAARARVA